jgi:hypothetical protein
MGSVSANITTPASPSNKPRPSSRWADADDVEEDEDEREEGSEVAAGGGAPGGRKAMRPV